MKLGIIYNEDCLEGMKRLPDKSVNLIIADPPYNIGKADWDKIPDYIEWLGKRLLEMQRILKDNGSFYLFHNDFLQMVEIQNWINNNSKFVFKQLIIWDKFHGTKWNQLNADVFTRLHRNYSKQAEYILFYTFQSDTGLEKVLIRNNFLKVSEKIRSYVENNFTKEYINELFLKEGRYTSQLSAKVHASYKMGWNNGKRFDLMDKKLFNYLNIYLYFPFTYEELKQEYESLRKECENLRYTFNDQSIPSIWQFPVEKPNEHITPKPIDLIKNILKHSSNKGDIVLIPFVGSGNDCIACKRLSRYYIGFEISKEYCSIALQKLEAEKTLWDIKKE